MSDTEKLTAETTIRPGTLDDAAILIDHMLALSNEEHNNILYDPGQWQYTLEQEQEWIRKHSGDQGAVFLAFYQDRLIGTCGIERFPAPTQAHVATLGVGIRREYRGRGVGTLLLQTVIDWAKEKKLRRVELEVHSRNTRAMKLYQRLGFIEEGHRRQAICKQGVYLDVVSMGLLL